MTPKLRYLYATVLILAAFVLLPGAASAVTFDTVQDGAFVNTSDVVITYSDPGGLNGANCVLDSTGPVTCSNSSVQLNGLAEGVHSLVVNGVVLEDDLSKCDFWAPTDPPICVSHPKISRSVQASMSFTVDTIAPAVVLSGGPAEGSSSTATSASFTIDPGDGTQSCTLDGNALTCGATLDLTGLAVGAHQLVVSSTDAAGNVGTATRNFTVTAPAPPASPAPAAPAPAIPAILSAPKSARIGKKIKLTVSCPAGCTINVVFKRRGAKSQKASIVVKPGATSVNFKASSKLRRKLAKALAAKKKVTAVFTPVGGASRSVRITR